MTLPEVAEGLHARGYNVLLYDARSVGGSEGQPRNLVSPLQMAEDLSGNVTRSLRALYLDCNNNVGGTLQIFLLMYHACAPLTRAKLCSGACRSAVPSVPHVLPLIAAPKL